MTDEELVKHWADEFNEIQEAKDARIEELQKQLAERDAALARCVEALGTIELEASIFRVDPPMSEDELMAKFEAISELAGNTLESLPTSAQATAKVLAAARHLASAWDAYNTSDFNDLGEQNVSIAKAESRLREAIREEQETK